MKYTFREFQKQYPDDDACLDSILVRRYGRIDHCPQCGVESKLTRIQGRRAYACKEGCHVYPCAGTIFEHSSTPLTLWFHAMYLMTATRNGVSAKELQRQLGVTYKCAWRIGHQLRLLMAGRNEANTPVPMTGHVEVDETYVGGKGKGMGKKSHRTIVMGILQREGAIKCQVVPNVKRATLRPIVAANAQQGSTVSTDELSSYRVFGSWGYNHGTVDHASEQWVNGLHHTNSIEGFWSHLKRGIRSTHVEVSRHHLQKYVEEFAFRYNNRQAPNEMFARMLQHITKA